MNKKQQFKKIEPVDVYCHLRQIHNENSNYIKQLNDHNLLLQIPNDTTCTFKSSQLKQLVYSFKHIYNDQSHQQQAVYDHVCLPLVHDLINAKNGLLFTYDVNDINNTSMSDTTKKHQESYLLQYALDTLFKEISTNQCKKNTFKIDTNKNTYELNVTQQREQQVQEPKNLYPQLPINSRNNLKLINDTQVYGIYLSAIEINNNNNCIYDLLADDSIEQQESKILKEDLNGQMFIKDLNQIEVNTLEEALEQVRRAQKKHAHTYLNGESSRSHVIFTIRLISTSMLNINDAFISTSQLSFVNLAAYEQYKCTNTVDCRLKEASNINVSLIALRKCIEALKVESSTLITQSNLNILKQIPYHESRLTHLFKNYFEGYGKIKMILCLNPSEQVFNETLNVLRFGNLIKDIHVSNTIQQQETNNNNNDNCDDDNHNELNKILLNINSYLINEIKTINEFPSIELNSLHDDVTINNLIEYLQDKQKCRQALVYEQQQKLLNKYLVQAIEDTLNENLKLKEENLRLKQKYDLKERNEFKMSSKIRALEKVINGVSNYYSNKQTSEHTFERKRLKENIVPSLASSNTNNKIIPPLCTPTSNKVSSIYTQHLASIQSRSNINNDNNNLLKSPFKRRDVKRRLQRRSKSADIWLEHRPSHTLKTDTLLQPRMQRKQSASRVEELKINDFKKSSKYLLTHQQQDKNDGELVTNLIRGNIMHSPSGGANIVFTNVETLKQTNIDEQLCANKRLSKNIAQENDDCIIESKAIVEDRCSLALEGHSSLKTSSRHLIK